MASGCPRSPLFIHKGAHCQASILRSRVADGNAQKVHNKMTEETLEKRVMETSLIHVKLRAINILVLLLDEACAISCNI